MDNGNNNLKIHFGYIIGILLLVIISLIVIKIGDNTKLVNYISFAVGLTSIFLAVISIIYAFYSNSSQSNILGKIDVTSERLNAASEDITQSSKILSSELQILKDTIKDIPDGINKMNSKIEDFFTNDKLLNNNDNLEERETRKEIQDEKFFKSFYDNYSTIGMIGLYIACLCNETKKEFNFEKTKIDEFNPNKLAGVRNYYYLHGCFVTLSSSFYFLRMEQNNSNNFIFKISFLSSMIKKEDIKRNLEERLDTGQKKIIMQIEEYFNQ